MVGQPMSIDLIRMYSMTISKSQTKLIVRITNFQYFIGESELEGGQKALQLINFRMGEKPLFEVNQLEAGFDYQILNRVRNLQGNKHSSQTFFKDSWRRRTML